MPLEFAPAVTGSLHSVHLDTRVGRWIGDLSRLAMSTAGFSLLESSVSPMWAHIAQNTRLITLRATSSGTGRYGGRAAALARHVAAVPVERPVVPLLTGNLLDDSRAVTGLTLGQIAQAVRVSERAVASWRAGSVPKHREPFFQQLRSIGLSLVGGLGPSGVQRWFLVGTPNRLERLAAGEVEQVVAEARASETHRLCSVALSLAPLRQIPVLRTVVTVSAGTFGSPPTVRPRTHSLCAARVDGQRTGRCIPPQPRRSPGRSTAAITRETLRVPTRRAASAGRCRPVCAWSSV